MTLRMGAATAIFEREMARRGWVQRDAGYQETLRWCDIVSSEREGRVITQGDLAVALRRVDAGLITHYSAIEIAESPSTQAEALELETADNLAAEPGGARLEFCFGGWAIVKRFAPYYTVECGAHRFVAASIEEAFGHIEETYGSVEFITIGESIAGTEQPPIGVR